jgi:hypothetical protein
MIGASQCCGKLRWAALHREREDIDITSLAIACREQFHAGCAVCAACPAQLNGGANSLIESNFLWLTSARNWICDTG